MRRIVRIVLMVLLLEILGLVLVQKEEALAPVLEKTQTPTSKPTIIPKPTTTTLESQNPPVLRTPSLDREGFKTVPTPVENWGVAKQIDEVTWTMKIGEDATMATVKEIFTALNEYRKVQGSQVLTLDEKLSNYAQERAKYLNGLKSVDQHKGFSDFVENQDGFNKLGFTALGENISYGFKLNGVHIIEWMYAGDKPHNDNQLDNRWNYVGIGVDGLATCLIFGTGKF